MWQAHLDRLGDVVATSLAEPSSVAEVVSEVLRITEPTASACGESGGFATSLCEYQFGVDERVCAFTIFRCGSPREVQGLEWLN